MLYRALMQAFSCCSCQKFCFHFLGGFIALLEKPFFKWLNHDAPSLFLCNANSGLRPQLACQPQHQQNPVHPPILAPDPRSLLQHVPALQEADVILISTDTAPPVCRLLSLDKYKYEQAKVDRDAKRKQRENRWACALLLFAALASA